MRKLGGVMALTMALSFGFAAPSAAQDPELREDPLFSTLFTPELIMQHRRAINLTDEQRDAISQMIQELQGRVVRLQWELLDQVQVLTETTSPSRVDLDRSLDQMDEVLETEKEIKQATSRCSCASRTSFVPSNRRRWRHSGELTDPGTVDPLLLRSRPTATTRFRR